MINVLAVVGESFAVYTVDKSQFDPDNRYDVIPDGIITPRDALVVINTIAIQSSSAQGEAEFARLDNRVIALNDYLESWKTDDEKLFLAPSLANELFKIVTI